MTIQRISGISGSSVRATCQAVRKRAWVCPVLAALLLGLIAWIPLASIEGAWKKILASNLQTVAAADLRSLQAFLSSREQLAGLLAADPQVRDAAAGLLTREGPNQDGAPAPMTNPGLLRLRELLQSRVVDLGFQDFLLIDREGRIHASLSDDALGRTDFPWQPETLRAVFDDRRPLMSRPYPSIVRLPDATGVLHTQVPTTVVAAPLVSPEGNVLAALALRVDPQQAFSRLLQGHRSAETAGPQTYLFDATGVMLSESPHTEQLKLYSLLPDTPEAVSMLSLELRDPQVDVTAGEIPTARRSQQPLTWMAERAVKGKTGVNADGYRDYRGVRVIGAWTWISDHGIGLATELDHAEAFRPLQLVRYALLSLIGLFLLVAVSMLVGATIVAVIRRPAAETESVKELKLGQYEIEEQIGRGGMGSVYRAQHLMLHRPTAIKLIDADKINEHSLKRFEREVKQASKLKHPNTIRIYDYGSTPDGVFYYAMELIEGMTLTELVEQYGPLPEGRVIMILKQLCNSLIEAHGMGIIHRDIKPSNILVSQMGGMSDFVKLLDFGLVKAREDETQLSLTADNTLTGTPDYMSPEAVQSPNRVDERSDLYSMGAVGYFLLTGGTIFTGETPIEVCMKHVNEPPEFPSRRLGKTLDPILEAVIMRCLDKDPCGRRPQSARELKDLLMGCRTADTWTFEKAERWWREHSKVGQGERSHSGLRDRSRADADSAPQADQKTVIVALNEFLKDDEF